MAVNNGATLTIDDLFATFDHPTLFDYRYSNTKSPGIPHKRGGSWDAQIDFK
jgi:hypothetical protein